MTSKTVKRFGPLAARSGAQTQHPVSIELLAEGCFGVQLEAGVLGSPLDHYTHFWLSVEQARRLAQVLNEAADFVAQYEADSKQAGG